MLKAAHPSLRRTAVLTVIALLTASAAGAAGSDCASRPGFAGVHGGGWGLDEHNSRFQPATTITADNVGRLALKWVYGFATDKPRSWPLVTDDTIFIGDSGRGLVALDRANGCTRWVYQHPGEIGTAILHHRMGARHALLFTSRTDGVYALDGATGGLLWHRQLEQSPVPMYSGSPLLHLDTLLVPVSSMEIGLALNPLYGCCTTSGALAALDADSGAVRWYRRTIDAPARVTGRHLLLVEKHGPSGAPVWGAPTVDAQRGLVYFGTGQNYSLPTTATSDAVMAVDLSRGELRWSRQLTAGDAYNLACSVSPRHPNCPRPMGPDLDVGAPPLLVEVADGQRLVVGQKSGDVYGLQPDTGELVWHQRVGRGGALGGVHWGMAFHPPLGLVLVPVSDVDAHSPARPAQPGLYALDAATGELRWSHVRKPRCADRLCSPGLSAAITATRDLVFAGSLDGYLEAYLAATGEKLWSHDAWREYPTVNGIPAGGGAFDAHGPLVVDDLVIVSAGYGSFGQRAGNALLVFALPEVAR